MTPTSLETYESKLQAAEAARSAGDCQAAFYLLMELRSHERFKWQPHLLVMCAELAQLLDVDEGPSLDQIRRLLEEAVALDPDSPEPLIELGHFVNAVEDRPTEAVCYFEQAEALAKDLLTRARDGLRGIRQDPRLRGHAEARACLPPTKPKSRRRTG